MAQNPENSILRYSVLEYKNEYDSAVFADPFQKAMIVTVHADLSLTQWLDAYIPVQKAKEICDALNAVNLQ